MKKGIEKIPLKGAKVSSAFRWRPAAKELIEEAFTKIYKKQKGCTGIVEQLLMQHLGITEDQVKERIAHPKKPGK